MNKKERMECNSMKNSKLILIILVTAGMLVMIGCSGNEEVVAEQENANANANASQLGTNANGVGAERGFGNQVVGQVVEAFGNEITIQLGIMNVGMERGEGEMPDLEAKREEMTEGGGMNREGMTEGAGMNREGMTAGIGMNRGEMSGGMETAGFAEMIQLTGEEATYIIPVGTPVDQFGTEMTFSQIAEDMYVVIVMNEEDIIVSIEILG